MSSNPRAFATTVLAAFEAAGLTTVAQVIAAGGPSTTTLTKLRKVAHGLEEMPEPREPTWSKIDSAAGWPRGGSRRVWRGEPPELAPRPPDPIDDLVHISQAFDELDDDTRASVVDFAFALLDLDQTPTVLVRNYDGSRLAIAHEHDGDQMSGEAVDALLDTATDILMSQPVGSRVVVQLTSPDGNDSLVVQRVPAPAERVRHQFADAARNPGKTPRGLDAQRVADASGEPEPDDPHDMESR